MSYHKSAKLRAFIEYTERITKFESDDFSYERPFVKYTNPKPNNQFSKLWSNDFTNQSAYSITHYQPINNSFSNSNNISFNLSNWHTIHSTHIGTHFYPNFIGPDLFPFRISNYRSHGMSYKSSFHDSYHHFTKLQSFCTTIQRI
eukprot:gene23700-25224_t